MALGTSLGLPTLPYAPVQHTFSSPCTPSGVRDLCRVARIQSLWAASCTERCTGMLRRGCCATCATWGMGLVLGGRARVVLTGHADASWELRWLTYLLTDLGEAFRSPPILYVDNKAMLALCEEHRLEHRTKHIALHYFLARELQQRGQLCLAYVASQANTADVFTKALQPCDHQRFCSVLGLVPTVPHLLTS
ncbi:unnamed protein product [Closterium sp. NIES-54]